MKRSALAAVTFAVSALACAHSAPAPSATHQTTAAPHRVVTTGSRIPGVQTGATAYTRDQVDATGRDGDLGAALRQLDPAVTTRR